MPILLYKNLEQQGLALLARSEIYSIIGTGDKWTHDEKRHMMRKRQKIFFITLVILLLTTVPCFGTQTASFRDGKIDLTFPDGWSVASEHNAPLDVAKSVGMQEEEMNRILLRWGQIFYAVKKIDGADTILKLSYSFDDSSNKQITVASAKELLNFHKRYKEDIAEEAFYQISPVVSLKGAKSFYTAYGPFIQMPVDIGSKESPRKGEIFYTVQDGYNIIFAMYTSNGKVTEQQLAEVKEIVATFFDTGFAHKMRLDGIKLSVAFMVPGLVLMFGPAVLIMAIRSRYRKKKGYHTLAGSEAEMTVNDSRHDTFELLMEIQPQLEGFYVRRTDLTSCFLKFKTRGEGLSLGEKILMKVQPSGEAGDKSILSISSYCWAPFSFEDWGKNEENIRNILQCLTAAWETNHPGNKQEAIRDLKIFNTGDDDWKLRQKLEREKLKARNKRPERRLTNGEQPSGEVDNAQEQMTEAGFRGVDVKEFSRQKNRHTKGIAVIGIISAIWIIFVIWRSYMHFFY